jgi:putative Mg2+ transporter-C (MgtC) family protein
VVGLTTAATIWVVAAVGAAVGAGAYVEASGTTVLMMLVLVGLRPLERRVLARRRRVSATLRVQRGVGFDDIAEVLRVAGVHVLSRRTFEHESDRAFELEIIGSTKQFDVAVDELKRRSDVISVTLD